MATENKSGFPEKSLEMGLKFQDRGLERRGVHGEGRQVESREFRVALDLVWVWGLGLGTWDLGFGGLGLGFGVWGLRLGFGVWGLGLRV